jgi:hypothetical protein
VHCAAAKKRERGPSVSERRAAEEAAAAEVAAKAKRTKLAAHGSAAVTIVEEEVAVDGKPMGSRSLGRGRAAMNLPLKLGGSVQAMEERKASLMAAVEFRPTAKMTAVAPAGTGNRATIEAEHRGRASSLHRACIKPASSHSIEPASSFQH